MTAEVSRGTHQVLHASPSMILQVLTQLLHIFFSDPHTLHRISAALPQSPGFVEARKRGKSSTFVEGMSTRLAVFAPTETAQVRACHHFGAAWVCEALSFWRPARLHL